MGLPELNARWQQFNAEVLIARGVRSCPNGCQCAEDNFCGHLYRNDSHQINDHTPVYVFVNRLARGRRAALAEVLSSCRRRVVLFDARAVCVRVPRS
jgi:hypothetical protein